MERATGFEPATLGLGIRFRQIFQPLDFGLISRKCLTIQSKIHFYLFQSIPSILQTIKALTVIVSLFFLVRKEVKFVASSNSCSSIKNTRYVIRKIRLIGKLIFIDRLGGGIIELYY